MSVQNWNPPPNHNPVAGTSAESDEQPGVVTPKLLGYYRARKFCDITLIAGIDYSRIKAHRVVLSSSSCYFRAMFSSNLSDANAKEVTLHDWDGKTLKTIVEYMYTKSIQLRYKTVENVLRAADFFQMNSLVDICCNFMANEMDSCNCLPVMFFAERHGYRELFNQSFKYVCLHFEEVCLEEEFLELKQDQLCRFISQDDLSVLSERSVLRNVVKWIRHDPENREQFITSLMKHIRFTLLDTKYIIRHKEHLGKNYESQKIILDWVYRLILPNIAGEYPQANYRTRKSNKKLHYLTGWDSDVHLKVQSYDAENNKWTISDWPNPRKNRKYFGTAAFDAKLYIVGGDIGGYTTADAECLDLETMQWSRIPSMQVQRRWFPMVELSGYLYAVGGIHLSWSRCVSKYDPKANTWIDVPPLPVQASYVQTVVLEQRLYAMCGESGTLMCYEPITNSWTILPMRSERSTRFGLGSVGGYLYTIGGRFCQENRKTVERFNPSTEQWSYVSPLSVGRSLITVVTLGNRLIACGGHDEKQFLKVVESYDPETDQWTTLAPLLSEGDSSSHLVSI